MEELGKIILFGGGLTFEIYLASCTGIDDLYIEGMYFDAI